MLPRSARRTVAVGVVAAFVLGLWFIFQQRLGLADRSYSSDFYDEQVRSWLDGRWAMPEDVLKLEGVESNGGLNMYFGPFPSLLRLPVLLVTTAFDGYLSQPSLALALVVFLGAATALWWQIRTLVRGESEPTRREAVTAAVALFASVTCTLYLTNLTSTAVYFEAIAWGVSLSLLSFAFLVSCLHRHRTVTAIGAISAAGAATLTRVTAGGGALAAIWIVGGLWFISWWAEGRDGTIAGRARRLSTTFVPALGSTTPSPKVWATWLGGAATFTVAYVWVNVARFGQMFSIPWENYVYNRHSTDRQLALAANDGTLMGIKFVPTTLWNYLRPDALDFGSKMPWIELPRRDVTRVGDVVLDITAPSSSLTATMPLFLLLLAVAAVAVFRKRRAATPDLRALRLPMLGAMVSTGGMWTAAFLAHRYMTDAVPLLILGAFAGHQVISGSLEARGPEGRRLMRSFTAVSAALLLWGAAVNVALSVENQKLTWPSTEQVRYEFVRRQYAGDDGPIRRVEEIPTPGERGAMISLGDCEALLWSNGPMWVVLEGEVTRDRWTPPPGQLFFDLDVAPTNVKVPRPPVLCRQLSGG